jgi:hypothetical protein
MTFIGMVWPECFERRRRYQNREEPREPDSAITRPG